MRGFALVLLFLGLATAPLGARGWYDGSPGAPWWEFDPRTPGGFTYIARPGQSVTSVGGLFTPRRVTVRENGPQGPVRTRFVYPSAFHSPQSLRSMEYGHGVIEVTIPDDDGLLYVNDQLQPRRGPVQVVTTPLLEAGQVQVWHLRAAFRSGTDLLVEDAKVEIRAGQKQQVNFTGARAVRVPLSRPAEQAPLPRSVPPTER